MRVLVARWLQARTSLPLEYNYAPRHLARYPRDIRLGDGSELRLQELRSENREQLKSFFAQCSQQAIYDRFLSASLPSDSMLDYLVDCNSSRHVALVLTLRQGDDAAIVAEGRYVILDTLPAMADIALLVAEQMQRRGIATLLIRELMKSARRNGVTHFSAEVSINNRGMLSLLRKVSDSLSSSICGGVVHLEIPIPMRGRARVDEAERDRIVLRTHAKRILRNLGVES